MQVSNRWPGLVYHYKHEVPDLPCTTIPGSAAPKPAPITGPASRPPWAVDPSFAERYAPDKTSTVVSKHSQLATPTPMQNRNSIVLAAQQAPESASKTPICFQCSKIIRWALKQCWRACIHLSLLHICVPAVMSSMNYFTYTCSSLDDW